MLCHRPRKLPSLLKLLSLCPKPQFLPKSWDSGLCHSPRSFITWGPTCSLPFGQEQSSQKIWLLSLLRMASEPCTSETKIPNGRSLRACRPDSPGPDLDDWDPGEGACPQLQSAREAELGPDPWPGAAPTVHTEKQSSLQRCQAYKAA